MAQRIYFHGEWSVECDQVNGDFSQRFKIGRTDRSEEIYPGAPGTQVARVVGDEWYIEMEWNDNVGSDWQPSDVRRSPSYTVPEGFVIRLEADDNFPDARDSDYDDMILICKSLDPEINPNPGAGYPFEFTISKEMLTDQ